VTDECVFPILETWACSRTGALYIVSPKTQVSLQFCVRATFSIFLSSTFLLLTRNSHSDPETWWCHPSVSPGSIVDTCYRTAWYIFIKLGKSCHWRPPELRALHFPIVRNQHGDLRTCDAGCEDLERTSTAEVFLRSCNAGRNA